MTVTATPTVEPDNWPPRVRIDVTASGGESETTITRLDPDGEIRTVRTDDGGPLAISGGTALAYDYEAPYGQPVSYSSVESTGTVSAEVTVDEAQIWLIPPGVPSLAMPIELRIGSLDEELWDVQQGTYWPLGGGYPIVHTDGQRHAPASSLTVAIESLVDLRKLKALLADASVLLLNIPPAFDLGVDTCYIAVGPVRNRRPSSIGSDEMRAVELPYQVVDQPVGGTQAQRTWADVIAQNATWSVVSANYSSWAALLAGP